MTPDMLPFSRQVQIACRFAEESTARLAGGEMPKAPDNAEKTLGELRGRIAAVLDYLKGFKPEQIDGSESREIELTIGGNPMKFTGEQYFDHFALPNFYFHCTTTYAILRQAAWRSGNGISLAVFREKRALGLSAAMCITARQPGGPARGRRFFSPSLGGWHAISGSAHFR